MGQFNNLTGRRFGSLTVVDQAGRSVTAGGTRFYTWNCLCDCGNRKVCRSNALVSGRNISCGCKQHKHEKHGYYFHPLYKIWTGMKGRCYDKNASAYSDYGARGITVCDEWLHDPSAFIEHILSLGWFVSSGLSIDRINNDLGYSPENVRLATPTMQSRNSRRVTSVELNGKTASLAEWSEILGIPYSRIQSRIYRGWSPERALTEAANR